MKQYMPIIDSCELSERRKQIMKEIRRGKITTFPSVASTPINRPYYVPESEEDETLVFESRFESGNLNLAAKLSDAEYNLILQNDLSAKGNTQWYFFRVRNTRAGKTIKFNIINLCKPDSLYNEGMKVLTYSEKSEKGWT